MGPMGPIVRELTWWHDLADGISGFVRWVDYDSDGHPMWFRVLDTRVEITDLTTEAP